MLVKSATVKQFWNYEENVLWGLYNGRPSKLQGIFLTRPPELEEMMVLISKSRSSCASSMSAGFESQCNKDLDTLVELHFTAFTISGHSWTCLLSF